jgi:hypothetical protein
MRFSFLLLDKLKKANGKTKDGALRLTNQIPFAGSCLPSFGPLACLRRGGG